MSVSLDNVPNPVAVPRILVRRTRALQILAALTALTVVGAGAARWMDQSSVETTFSKVRLFPGMSDKLNNIAGLSIETKDKLFAVTKTKDGHWVLPGKNNFAADRDLVQSTLIALSETDLVEQRTARLDWHKRLDLNLPKDGGAGAILTLTDTTGEKVGQILVGKGVEGANVGDRFAAYVRRVGEDQTYVALGKLQLKAKDTDWLDKRFLDFDRSRIREASIRPAKGPAYVVSRAKPTDDNFALLTPLPKGRTLRTEREPNGVGQALFNLNFDDVVPANTLDFSKATFAGFKTFNGVSLSFAVIDKDQSTWVTVNATAVDQPPPEPKPGVRAEVLASVESKTINARAAGWAFKLPRFKGVLMTAPLEDLLLPVGGPPPGPSVEPATPTKPAPRRR